MVDVGLILVAAGKGERLGFPAEKALVPLLGHPILSWALLAFEDFHQIVERIVVVPPGRESEFQDKVIAPMNLKREVTVIAGGARRQDSVANGIAAMSDRPHWVMVHDAARPLVSHRLITSILETIDNGESVIPALPMRDSIARVGYDSWIKSYEDRSKLLAVQTPQAFHRPVLEYAHTHARENKEAGTDEASLVLRVNHPVAWIEGEADNIKITYPADVTLAEAILRTRGFSADHPNE